MLAEAISTGRVRACGRPTPHALVEPIPSDQFRISGLTLIVTHYGDLATSPPHKLSTYTGCLWRDIEFDPDEIKRAFSKPPPSSAVKWMLKKAEDHAAAGHLGKRAFMIRDCMAAIGCTKREAEAAYKLLPGEFKRQLGKPRKNRG